MDFEGLQELSRLITRHKVKQIELLGDASEEGESSRLNKLYNGLANGMFETDDDAAQYLWGEQANANHPEYRKLRMRLVRQLVNSAFFVDKHESLYTERGKAQDTCYKDFAAATILLARDARQAGIFLMNQVIEIGIKYELVELVADAARALRRLYTNAIGDTSKYEKYAQIHREYEEKRRWEIEAFEEYQYVQKHYMGGRATNKELFAHTSKIVPVFMQHAPKVATSNYYFYCYAIAIAHHLSANNAQKALLMCNEAIDILQKKNTHFRAQLLVFVLNKLDCLIQLRQLDLKNGEKTYQICLDQTNIGDTNWFKTLSIWLHFNLYAKEYTTAFKVYLEATEHPRYKLMTGMTAEQWRIYAGYFQLLACCGKIDAKLVTEHLGEFKSTRFLNDFEVLTKEKDGMNIPIMLLPFIFSLLLKDDALAGKTDEGLDKYRQRYLQNPQNIRSAIFMKILFAVTRRPLSDSKTQKKIADGLEELSKIPIEMAGQSYAIEIIPYEDIWELINSQLK